MVLILKESLLLSMRHEAQDQADALMAAGWKYELPELVNAWPPGCFSEPWQWFWRAPAKRQGRSQRFNHMRQDAKKTEIPLRYSASAYYCGPVCNLEVETDHSYCVPVAVHNCWIEKDAVSNIVKPTCEALGIAYFSCRGYTSQSEMWEAAQRLRRYSEGGQPPLVFHLGDHDPSGIDMTRDIQARLEEFSGVDVKLERLALNMDQIEQYGPPPNPAKLTDSRSTGYISKHGDESWELDALTPEVMSGIINQAVLGVRDADLWAEAVAEEQRHREQLSQVSQHWETIIDHL